MATSSNNAHSRMSREDYNKAKELEEMRKAGSAMPATDEEGKLINPHIPHYISNVPWYYGETGTTLRHQTTKNFESATGAAAAAPAGGLTTTRAYVRSAAAVGARFRPGSCANCGAIDHAAKQCLERPRAKTARLLDTTLVEDRRVVGAKLDWEGQRDSWQNVDAARVQQEVVARHAKADAERARVKEEQLRAKLQRKEQQAASDSAHGDGDGDGDTAAAEGAAEGQGQGQVKRRRVAGGATNNANSDSDSDAGGGSDSGSDAEDDDLADAGRVQQKRDARSRGTVRNLRIREDTAKYLRNLDLSSAFYDPKTRSMRENPYAADDPRALLYAGDNALRAGGEAAAVTEYQRFALQRAAAAEAASASGAAGGGGGGGGGGAIGDMITPSSVESEYKAHLRAKEEQRRRHEELIAQKYGTAGAGAGESAGATAATAAAAAATAEAEAEAVGRLVAAGGVDGGIIVRTARNKRLLYDHDDAPADADVAAQSAGAASALAAETEARSAAAAAAAAGAGKRHVHAGARATRYLAPGDANPTLVPVTKYIEDEWLGNHTSVFGSWYDRAAGRWGYACCRQTARAAYCVPIVKQQQSKAEAVTATAGAAVFKTEPGTHS